MLDRRNALPSGTALVLGREYTYTIQEEMGRGASCICYDALYADAAGLPHRVRIKECFPYYIDISRSRQGVLDVPKECQAQFASAKEKFYAAYLKNVELKLTLGLINSTADAIGIFDQNNTWYVVMGCVEGVDYRTETDSSLQSVFIRMKALSKIIQKYHSQGVLHLDIKPENILVIPETLEHMVLFDFDSLITAEELQKEVKPKATCAAADKAAGGAVAAADMASGADLEAGGFFSDGFAAPELVQGRWERICEATDLYAIGAITFYKLFGRTPSPEDAAMGATYDFSCMREFSCREQGKMAYPPELFQALTQFFQKTLSSFVPGRYQSAEEAIIFLDTLIRLSDPERPFLCSNFSYHSSCFVGRRAELREIAENLQGSHVLFLSGMGGIGKTETARRFAYEHQECFRNILFVPFRDSILKTVCGSGIQIHRVQRAAGESEGEFFTRKLQVMRQIATPEDLVILDNFDVESDPCLEDLLECPCKFLITSREDFRDYNYVQTEINRMEDMGELLALFRAYHPEEYEAGEEENVKAILELVEGHTMTVELIAKYLRDTGEMPSALLGKLLEADGLLGTGEKKVRQRKDRKLQAGSISRHLRALFNLSCFSEGESELIKSLSLMGAVRIRRDTFLGFCKMEGNGAFLANLIRRGWIQFEPDTEKVSLHQIIMDLVYHDMQPTSEQCPHFVASMAAYAQQECNGLAEWDVREGLLGRLLSRLRGEDLNYASLVVAYCTKIAYEDHYFAHAETICRRYSTKASKGLLQQIYMEKLRNSKYYVDVEFEPGLKEGESYSRMLEAIAALARESYGYAKEYSEESKYSGESCVQLAKKSEYLGRTCAQLAKELDLIACNYFMLPFLKPKQLSQVMHYEAFLWKEAGTYLLAAEMDIIEKIEFLTEARDFFHGYGSEPYVVYRTELCGDFQLAQKYQDIISGLLEKAEPEVKKHLQEGRDLNQMGLDFGGCAQDKGECERVMLSAWEYMDSIPDRKDRIAFAFEAIRHISEDSLKSWKRKIYQYIFRQCKGRQECEPFLVKALLEYARFISWGNDGIFLFIGRSADARRYKKALKYCENAHKLYEQRGMNDAYLYSLIHSSLEECYSCLDGQQEQMVKEREKCDYYLLAEHDAKDVPVQEAIELWHKAAGHYESIGRWDGQERCYRQMFQLFDPCADWLDKEALSTFQFGFRSRIQGLEKQKKELEILEITVEYYKGILRHCFLGDEKNGQGCQERDVDFCECVSGIARSLCDTIKGTAPFILYVLAILAEAGHERRVEREVFEGIEDYFAGDWERLLQSFRDIMHSTPSEKMIGRVMILWDEMQNFVTEGQIAEFREEIQCFLDTYQYAKIAFKR